MLVLPGGVDEAIAIALSGDVRQRGQREHAGSQQRSPHFHARLRIRSDGKLARQFTERPATPSRDEFPKPRNLSVSFAGLNDPLARGQCS